MANSREADRLLRAFGTRLRASRISAGYETAAQLAAELRVEEPRYRRYERGEAMMPIDILTQTGRLLGKNLHWLLTGAGPTQIDD